jgi:hypothetical protein
MEAALSMLTKYKFDLGLQQQFSLSLHICKLVQSYGGLLQILRQFFELVTSLCPAPVLALVSEILMDDSNLRGHTCI